MLRPRLIPSLLLSDGALVKTTRFRSPKYIGDPLNAIRIFNEKQCDELVLFDISCSSDGSAINFSLLEKIARTSNMPLCYGGGIRSLHDAKRLINLGIEKVSISSTFFSDPDLVLSIASEFGNQSVILTLDVKKDRFTSSYRVFTCNGTKKVRSSLESIVDDINRLPLGELIINTIHSEGTMSGYDLNLLSYIRANVSIPVVILGGASSLDDVKSLFNSYSSNVAASASSIFVFQGKYKSVLISYPDSQVKNSLYGHAKNQ